MSLPMPAAVHSFRPRTASDQAFMPQEGSSGTLLCVIRQSGIDCRKKERDSTRQTDGSCLEGAATLNEP